MEQSALEVLKRCYANSREPVTLLDERWNVLWQNIPIRIGYLPELLGVPEDFWETCTRNVKLGAGSFKLQLLCSREDGIRIAALSDAPQVQLPMESDLLSNVAHSVFALTDELHRVLDENDLYDDICLLTALRGNCMRLYRPAYLQRELERYQAGLWRQEQFSVRQQLAEMCDRIRRTLGRSADIVYEPGEDEPFITGDLDAFQIAVLSALAVTFDDTEHRLEIRLSLSADENACTVTVSTAPTPELRTDAETIMGDAGSTYPEQVMLNCFCEAYGGSWMEGTAKNAHFCRINIPTGQCLCSGLMSIHGRQESRFFNKYEILLARIHLQRMG